MYPRYRGPMVVIRRTKGGAYIIAEMDGTVLREKVAAFWVLPHVARYEPIELNDNIHELIDTSANELDELVKDESSWEADNIDFNLVFDAIPHLRLSEELEDEDEDVAE